MKIGACIYQIIGKPKKSDSTKLTNVGECSDITRANCLRNLNPISGKKPRKVHCFSVSTDQCSIFWNIPNLIPGCCSALSVHIVMWCVVIGREYLVGKLSSVPRISCSSPEIIVFFVVVKKLRAFFVIFRCHFVLRNNSFRVIKAGIPITGFIYD